MRSSWDKVCPAVTYNYYISVLLHCDGTHTRTHTHLVLTAISSKPRLASCPLIFLTKAIGAKFYKPDVLPGTNQQKRNGLHFFLHPLRLQKGRVGKSLPFV